jgi:hypothetical protein
MHVFCNAQRNQIQIPTQLKQHFCQFKTLYDGAVKTTIMQPFDLHPEFYSQPIWLTQEEKENPTTVINLGQITKADENSKC